MLIWLVIQGIFDWKYQKIPVWLSAVGGGIGILFCFLQKRPYDSIALSCVPGIVLLIFSKLTGEVIGYGDGVTVLIMGLYLSFEMVISTGTLAFFIAGIVALGLLVIFRKGRTYRIPFLPFLSATFLLEFLLK